MQEKMVFWIDVRKLRQERGWRQNEAARKLGVSRSYLSAVENGGRYVSMNMMAALMRVFDINYDDFHKFKNPPCHNRREKSGV
ncbi:MAG: helix-turn-helix transcriptional regulator [Oscillospiraceae bacterium]|jgi:transcriptional regulator with XRE-family HTH domain|nr:helix-turn-helix transcriptional regulator [Oscillospiraceae bacterium]